MSDVPEKYEIIGGVWDTDIVFNTTLTNKVGDGCIEFKNTTPTPGPQMRYSDFIPVESGAPYSIYAWLQASRISVGDNLYLEILWYDDDQSYLSASSAFNGVLPAINTWYRIGSIFDAPSGARYAKPNFGKFSVNFTAYVDDIIFSEMPIIARVIPSSNQNLTSGSWNTIRLNTEQYDYGQIFDTGTYTYTIPVDGLYDISAYVTATKSSAPSSGMRMLAAVWKGSNGLIYVMYESELTAALIGSTYSWHRSVGIVELLSRGDTLTLRAFTDDTGTIAIVGDPLYTGMSVARVE